MINFTNETPKWKKVYNNTYRCVTADGTECIKLHNTVIYTKTPTDVVTLNSGGYHTVTTKRRLNSYLEGTPFYVEQKDFDWFLWNRRADSYQPFEDGISFKV